MVNYLERQYLGKNIYSFIRRLIIALFCIVAGFWIDDQNGNSMGLSFCVIGGIIFIWSIVLFKILHIQTKLDDDFLILEGHWTTRKVKIDLRSIESVTGGQYNPIFLKNPVYNLHRKNKVHFYTHGQDVLVLKDRTGTEYLIGTQKLEQFEESVLKAINLNQ
ncbi:MAG: hypothetical protein ACPG6V_10720 [Flavobacteriales bacterium]